MKLNVEVTFIHDEEPPNPREWEDHYGIMACSHLRYNLGDEQINASDFNSWDEVEEYLIKECGAVVILPLYLYDHSGISISIRSFYGRAHHAQWDSGQVGFIYATRKNIEKMQGWKVLTATRLAKVEGYLQGEVETYDKYLTGDAYGYRVEINGEEVESCWGFFGTDYAKEEAISSAVSYLERELEASLEVSYA